MQVRQLILTASALVIAGAGPAHAQDSARVAGDSGLQSLVAEALARNPGARAGIQLFLILGLALIESLALYALVIIALKT